MNKPILDHVLQFGTYRNSGKRRIGAMLRSNRFALLGAILFAILIPELLHPLIARTYPWVAIFTPREPELYVSTLALLGAHVGLRKIGILPLVDNKVLVLPSFLVSYALAMLFMTFAWGGFGHYHLATSFTIGGAWYYFVAMLRARTIFPRLAYVGEMLLDNELLSARIEWVALRQPRLPHDVLGIVFDSEQDQSPAWERFFSRAVLRNIPVYDIAHLREMALGRVRLRTRPELVFGQLLPSQPYLRIKRIVDTIVAIPAIIIVIPIMAMSVLLIRLESPGPALYRQRRVGYQGRIFSCYKLRSMRSDGSGPAFTQADDPRITRVGRIIRKWHIDELPQLFNIVKGDMSWIGPRPEALALARAYQREIPYYAYRHSVRPGISGWAAVHQGNVALTEAATLKLEYDFYYIKFFSIWLDFLIVLMTLRTIVTRFGAR